VNRLPRKELAIAAAVAAVLLALWFMVLRPDDGRLSTYGFDLSTSPGGSAPGGARPAPWAARSSLNTSLKGSFSRERSAPPAALPASAPAEGGAADLAAAAPAAPAAPSAASPPAAAPKAEELSAEDKAAAARAGVPQSPRELNAFGGSRALFKAIIPRLAQHPKILGMLLNNRYVVEGYMSRQKSKDVFGSPDGVKKYLSDIKSQEGVADAFPLLRAMLKQNPEIAGVIAGSELASRILDTPGMQGFIKDPASVVLSNPEVLAFVGDPAVVKGLAANPGAAAALDSVQKNLGVR
jgi:hypothetical protein